MLKLMLFLTAISCTTAQYENRVVNGTDAEEGEFPYMVSMRKNNGHDCGGSILDETHILTAAHCVFGTTASLSVQFGSLLIDPNSENVIDVASFLYHEDYVNDGGLFNDVAILTLASPLIFSSLVQPTVLPPQDEPTPAGEIGILTGWGLNGTNGILMQHLQKVELNIFSDDECETLHDNNTNRQYHVCAGVPEGGKGQCTHDSGSPLAVNGIQRGIVSWSVKPCTIAPYPGVYVNVARYVDWICSRSSCTVANK